MLGCAIRMPTHSSPTLDIHSESGNGCLFLVDRELDDLVDNIINQNILDIPTAHSSYKLEFSPLCVTINFNDFGGCKTYSTFNEVELVRLIDIFKVRKLVLSRKI